jgi:hypothetical protein
MRRTTQAAARLAGCGHVQRAVAGRNGDIVASGPVNREACHLRSFPALAVCGFFAECGDLGLALVAGFLVDLG